MAETPSRNGSRNGTAYPDALRARLVNELVQEGLITSAAVEAAFRAVPRHLFLPDVPIEEVYRDEAIPTKRIDGRVVSSSSQPAIMAIMLEQLAVAPGQRVLEIGAGTGYNAALLAYLTTAEGRVTTIDLDEDIVIGARQHLRAAGYDQVEVVQGDGAQGYTAHAPYDRIILTVGASDILPAWREQLRPGGRLVLPLSFGGPQMSLAFDRPADDDRLMSVSARPCGFMRLRGPFAGPEVTLTTGGQPGTTLLIDAPGLTVDGERLVSWLSGPSHDLGTGVIGSQHDAWGSLSLWLATRLPGFGMLAADGASATLHLPFLLGIPGRYQSTYGLLDEDGPALLYRWPEPSAPDPAQDRHGYELRTEGHTFELRVRAYGDGAAGRRLVEEIRAWHAAGRPALDRLRIVSYPHGAAPSPAPGETLLRRTWSDYLCRWR